MFGGMPQTHYQITSGLAGEEELCIPFCTEQIIPVIPSDPKYKEVYDTIEHRIHATVPCAHIVKVVRKVHAEQYIAFRKKLWRPHNSGL